MVAAYYGVLSMLPRVNKILFATDLSENAQYACNFALSIAKDTGAEVHVLHVLEKLSSDIQIALRTYMLDKSQRNNLANERMSGAKQLLESQMKQCLLALDESDPVKSQVASIKILDSYPAEEILNKAEEIGVDLIVMGAHDRGVQHTFLGSVTKSTLRRTHIPVMVVPLPEAKKA